MSPIELPSRIPPHNLDAERAVLGAMLLEGREALPRVVEVLRPSDFYTEAHRAIYQSMLTLFDRGEPVDLLTLQEELRRTDQLSLVGGPAALALLVEQGSVAAYLASYTAIVRDMAVLRELIQTATHIIGQAFEAKEDVQALVDDAERRIFSLAERRLEGSAIHVKNILNDTFKYIERLYERQEHVTGVPTGLNKLDEMTAGLQPSDLILIAGRPSMGKAQPLDAQREDRRAAGSAWAISGWAMSWRRWTAGARGSARSSRRASSRSIRVTFSDGRSRRVHRRPSVARALPDWPEPRMLTTERVAEMLGRPCGTGIGCGSTRRRGQYGHAEPLPMDPWMLGALLGDGKLSGSSLVFSTAAARRCWTGCSSALATASSCGPRAGTTGAIVQVGGRPPTRRLPASRPTALMRRCGRWGCGEFEASEKFIPDLYLHASREARLDLLRGLMDTDGWVESWGSMRFCSTSERLARGRGRAGAVARRLVLGSQPEDDLTPIEATKRARPTGVRLQHPLPRAPGRWSGYRRSVAGRPPRRAAAAARSSCRSSRSGWRRPSASR